MRFSRRCFLSAILSLSFGAMAAPAQICPDWQDAHTKTVEAKPGDNLAQVVQGAASGTTILLNAGTYKVSATLQFAKDDVTLRSKSGKRDDVILDGNGGGTPLSAANFLGEILAVSASRVTIADLSIRYAKYHAIHAYAPAGRNIAGVRMRNLHVYDCAEQQIKVNSNGLTPTHWVDSGIVECSLVEFLDNSVMEPMGDSYYTGGIDVHGGQDWVVRANTFRNIQRNGALMEHAVHFWNKSRGTIIENNRFENNYRAIGLGMRTDRYTVERKYPDGKGDQPYMDHIGGIIRNNVIWNKKGVHLEAGIEIMNALDAGIYNNTIYSGDAPFSGIEYRWPNTTVILKNNLLSHNLRPRDGAKAVLAHNVENAGAALFKDAANGDLHLAATAIAAIDKGEALAGILETDAEGKPRGVLPDIGALEFGVTSRIGNGGAWLKEPAADPMPGPGARASGILFLGSRTGPDYRLVNGAAVHPSPLPFDR